MAVRIFFRRQKVGVFIHDLKADNRLPHTILAEEMTTAGSGIVMAVILVFLLLGGLVIYFFGDLIFAAAAFALLAALLISRLGLSPCIHIGFQLRASR